MRLACMQRKYEKIKASNPALNNIGAVLKAIELAIANWELGH